MVLTQKWTSSCCLCARGCVVEFASLVCVSVCLHTMTVTVERELGGAVLRSILMPLSLLSLVPFPQLPLAFSERWRVGGKEGETSHPDSGDGHSLLRPNTRASAMEQGPQDEKTRNFEYILELIESLLKCKAGGFISISIISF